jgi:hypothetical protein
MGSITHQRVPQPIRHKRAGESGEVIYADGSGPICASIKIPFPENSGGDDERIGGIGKASAAEAIIVPAGNSSFWCDADDVCSWKA